jgi:hypothetical protein
VCHPEIAIFVLATGLMGSLAGVRFPYLNSAESQQQEAVKPRASGSCGTAQPQDTGASTPELILKDGTPVPLRFGRRVLSSQVIAGEKIELEVTTEVRMGDLIVICKYSPAQATVTLAQAKRAMGRGGNMAMKIETVRLANGETAPLRMIKEVKGGEHKGEMVGGMVAAGLVFLPAAPFLLFVQGKDAEIPKGTEITAYVDGDVALTSTKLPLVSKPPQVGRDVAVPKVQVKDKLR